MKCLSPRRITKNLDPVKFPDGLLVPCGQCMHCRLLRREAWCLRIIHESSFWDSCIFFTLTYNDEHLPDNCSLVKSDLQKFFKRLRKNLGKRRIKYYAAGEYGEKTGRPHYHVICFGLDYLSAADKQIVKDAWTFCTWSSLGGKPFGDVCMTSIRYVVGYLEKSMLGLAVEEEYLTRQQPFNLVSKGIGRRYAIAHSEDFERTCECIVQGEKRNLPRYYTDITGVSRDLIKERAKLKEVECVNELIGDSISSDELYHCGTKDEILFVQDAVQQSAIQHDLNLKAKLSVKQRRKSKGM